MAARTPVIDNLPTRVSVLEHGVQELKSGLDSHRSESRQSFVQLQAAIERMGGEVAKRATPTNWNAFISAIAGTVAIISAVFGLAEWRVTSAYSPLWEARKEDREALKDAWRQINELRIQAARQTVARDGGH